MLKLNEKVVCFIKKVNSFCTKHKIIVALCFVFFAFLISVIPKAFAQPQPIKSVEIFSESADYSKKEPGAWKITKSAKWVEKGVAEITFDVDTAFVPSDKNLDVLFVVDTSDSMTGDRMNNLKESLNGVIERVLLDSDNRVGLISFNTNSEILTNFTNNKDLLSNGMDRLSSSGNRNYYRALLNVNNILKDYKKDENRECIVVFVVNGESNADVSYSYSYYDYLIKEYPFLIVNGIQYDIDTNSVLNTLRKLTDSQFVADMENLSDILFEASVISKIYESFIITDFINTDYFSLSKESKIEVSVGDIVFDETDQKIDWIMSDLKSGMKAEMKARVKLNENNIGDNAFYKINKKEEITSKIGESEENVESYLTPIIADNYKVIYDGNAPEGCAIEGVPEVMQIPVLETVEISQDIPLCVGYQFKGWDITNEDVLKVNSDHFIMPEEDVIIRAKWSKIGINKSVDGKIEKGLTLYRQVEQDVSESTKYAKKYTGDRSTFSGDENIYYYYGTAANNNVIFGPYCWKIIRTTDTGGVKLIYNGVPSTDGKCDNNEKKSALTKEQMNASSDTIAFNTTGRFLVSHVGYMYNTTYDVSTKYAVNMSSSYLYGNSFTYENGKYTLVDTVKSSPVAIPANNHYTCFNTTGVCEKISYVFYYASNRYVYFIEIADGKSVENALDEMFYNDDVNKNDSTIKSAIDYWYENNMTEYTKYLEDTVWCNDRSMANEGENGWNPNGGSISLDLQFKSYVNRNDLTCKNINDRFTTSKLNGNGFLTYPVGLIDATEANLAYENASSPVDAGNISYWTMSPSYFSQGNYIYNYAVHVNGKVDRVHNLTTLFAVRPAVSLRSGIMYTDGDGTTDRPYVIDMNS